MVCVLIPTFQLVIERFRRHSKLSCANQLLGVILCGFSILLPALFSTSAIAKPSELAPSHSNAQTRTPAAPRATLVLLDKSNSLKESFDMIRQGLLGLERSIPKDGEFGLIAFDVAPWEVLSLRPNVEAKAHYASRASHLFAMGRSDLAPGLSLAVQRLLKSTLTDRRLVIVTDGQIHDLGKLVEDLLTRAHENGVVVSVVLVGSKSDIVNANLLAKWGGGSLTKATTSEEFSAQISAGLFRNK